MQQELMMATQSEKINKLDKDIALIKQELNTVKNNHLYHLEKKVDTINKVLWSVGILVLSNLLIVLRDIII
jgi:beta-lactamase regulating signal transducer with metallopeptidase domain